MDEYLCQGKVKGKEMDLLSLLNSYGCSIFGSLLRDE